MKSVYVAIAALATPALALNHFGGIVASPVLGEVANVTCRTQAQWDFIVTTSRNNNYTNMRIPGLECNALDMASTTAANVGVKIIAGISINGTIAANKAKIDADVETFRAAYAKFGPSRFAGLTIGNEVNDSAHNIMDKVLAIRSYLKSVGVTTPVSTAHTWSFIQKNPVLCGADFVGANANAFYDGGFNSTQAGDFVMKKVVPALKSTCRGRQIIITASGWPSRGGSIGSAVASLDDEMKALISLNCAARTDNSVSIYVAEVDDQDWKSSEVEASYGIKDKLSFSAIWGADAPC